MPFRVEDVIEVGLASQQAIGPSNGRLYLVPILRGDEGVALAGLQLQRSRRDQAEKLGHIPAFEAPPSQIENALSGVIK